MTFSELVKKRQSTRNYSSKPIEKEKITACLEAARLAPSACNGQPWTFIIVDDPTLKNKLSESAFHTIYSMNKFVQEAPVIIVVVSERGKFITKIGSFFRRTNLYLLDIGIACEHFILQAAELGLGTCWIGWFDEKNIKKILNIPKSKKIDTLISLGYPSKDNIREKVRESLNSVSSFNKYS